ncbi:MAG: sigma 54-interacting transcriptional regulator [Bryobacteraceae bacterium]
MSDFALATPALLGDSPRIREIRALIPKLARSRSPLLLLGETGTGKEVLARAIHAAAGPGCFVPIDCSVLGNLLETELFGHMRGAFTGAVANKPGLLEIADGGTAFLDEVGELPLDLQTKLLRVLQDREIRPLGSVVHRKTDFRTIAATNRDLAADVARGRFRRDLYYRLNVVTLRLPPLRERKQDIPALTACFLARHGRSHQLTPELVDLLARYDWPGNVRELENCIQRMVAINSGPLLHPADLPSALHSALFTGQPAQFEAAAAPAAPAVPRIPPSSVLPLNELERQAIAEALSFTRGDRARAAALLGIGRTTLYRKLKHFRLAGT